MNKYFLLILLTISISSAQENYNKDVLEKKIYPMGKKIFQKRCAQNIDLSKYKTIDDLKADIKNKNICKVLKSKHIEALSLYVWDIKRLEYSEIKTHNIILKQGEKCPVCGMFTYKYPKWATQVFYKHNSHEHHHSFDGVKDMMKFYFSPMKWGDYKNSKKENIEKILVTDYYSQKAIDATKAYYVIGSDVYGPMGDELIPFKNKEEAQTFKMDHKGKKLVNFNDITEDEVYKLDY
ncbi:nitrous oxide reductase accessory protein NosL [Sulfurimonas sp.]|uniref:nitrous oxide reductase accessory protein NosL n=1 Tax=Sulfurimonas sp. TaxID=2022749 RepID=UPI00356A1F4C